MESLDLTQSEIWWRVLTRLARDVPPKAWPRDRNVQFSLTQSSEPSRGASAARYRFLRVGPSGVFWGEGLLAMPEIWVDARWTNAAWPTLEVTGRRDSADALFAVLADHSTPKSVVSIRSST